MGNFSSSHPFIFTDGSVLPAVSSKEAKRLMVTFLEKVAPSFGVPGDIILDLYLSDEISKEMDTWISLWERDEVNVVFCSLPMMLTLKHIYGHNWVMRQTPFRFVYFEDKIKKLVSIPVDTSCEHCQKPVNIAIVSLPELDRAKHVYTEYTPSEESQEDLWAEISDDVVKQNPPRDAHLICRFINELVGQYSVTITRKP